MFDEFTDDQLMLLMATLAKQHMIWRIQNKDNSEMEKIIKTLAKYLESVGKEHIFHKVYQENKKNDSGLYFGPSWPCPNP